MFEEVESTETFVDFWNDVLVPKFVRFRHILVEGLSKHSEAAYEVIGLSPGDNVMDVGCGFGDTAIQMSRMVGPNGRVLGIDCCEGFLKLAREDASKAGVSNVGFVEGDVQVYPFKPEFDLCFARFGAMFFENPVAGLRNMRTSLKPGGRTMLMVWRTIEDNPWFRLPKEIVLKYLPPPGDGARTCGPGPFSMANQEMVTKQLEIAGYSNIDFQRVDAPVMVGNDIDDAIAFQLALGPAGEVYREAGDEAEARKDEIYTAMSETLSEYLTDEGVVLMSSSWNITATNPA